MNQMKKLTKSTLIIFLVQLLIFNLIISQPFSRACGISHSHKLKHKNIISHNKQSQDSEDNAHRIHGDSEYWQRWWNHCRKLWNRKHSESTDSTIDGIENIMENIVESEEDSTQEEPVIESTSSSIVSSSSSPTSSDSSSNTFENNTTDTEEEDSTNDQNESPSEGTNPENEKAELDLLALLAQENIIYT